MSHRTYSQLGHRNGGDKRGSSRDRRARKMWMLSPEAPFGGNGLTVPCVHCGDALSFDEIEQDRIIPGGSYRRDNLQPSCRLDNIARSNKIEWAAPRVLATA